MGRYLFKNWNEIENYKRKKHAKKIKTLKHSNTTKIDKRVDEILRFLHRRKPSKKTHLIPTYPPVELYKKMFNEGKRDVCPKGYIFITWLHFRVYEHSLVVRINNIDVPKGFAVHHIDRNKLNNNINNLKVMHWKDHFKEHHKKA